MKKAGYNEQWKTIPWKDSDAAKNLMAKDGKEYLPRIKPLTEKKKSEIRYV